MSQTPGTTRPAPRGPRVGNFTLFAIIAVAAVAIFLSMSAGQNPWDALFINPLINSLILLDRLALGQFGLAIIVFTLVLRLVTLPFTLRQLHSTRALQSIAPRQQEIQKKYKDPKRRQEEIMKLYREAGINPLGCVFPLAIQMVVFIALYRALVHLVGGSPESLIGLGERVYPWSFLTESIPLEQHFLWLNLGRPDTTLILPILTGVSTYLQQKLTQTPATTPQQQQQQQMMNWMMPLFLVWITLTLPSGVGVYWVASNLFGVLTSYYFYGRRSFRWRDLLPMPAPAAQTKPDRVGAPANEPNQEPQPVGAGQRKERVPHGRKRRGKRKNRR